MGVLFLGVRRQECQADESPKSNTEVKNEWRYTSSHPHTFMACNGANVSLLLITYSHATRSPTHMWHYAPEKPSDIRWVYRSTQRHNLPNKNVWTGDKLDHGIRNFNLPRSQVRKRGKFSLNQSLIYIPPFPPTLTPMFILPSSTRQLKTRYS